MAFTAFGINFVSHEEAAHSTLTHYSYTKVKSTHHEANNYGRKECWFEHEYSHPTAPTALVHVSDDKYGSVDYKLTPEFEWKYTGRNSLDHDLWKLHKGPNNGRS